MSGYKRMFVTIVGIIPAWRVRECDDCQLVAGRVRTGVHTLCLHWTQWPPLHWITQGALGLYHDQ